MSLPFQHTLAHSVSCVGVALHTGAKVSMRLSPASEDTGIVFYRTDVDTKKSEIRGHYRNVSCTTLGTTVSNKEGISLGTIEHLMAAFWGCRIDNAIVEVNGPEVPIMDGSSEPFVFLIECAGSKKQSKPRKIIEVLKRVEVNEGDKYAAIAPAHGFSVSLEIEFADAAIAKQRAVFHSDDISFKTDLCRARTFGFEHEVEHLRQLGLARGGSLDNAVVVSDGRVLNAEGLRYKDEFVRHKILDCIGDVYLTGAELQGHFTGFRSGHALNNQLLRKFFADKEAWRILRHPEAHQISLSAGRA